MFDDISLAGWLRPTDEVVGIRTPGGDVPMKMCESAPMGLGPFRLGVQRGCLWPGLFNESRKMGVNARGIVGMTALRDKVFTIDFDRGVVRFSRSVAPNAGTPIQIQWNRGVPFAIAQVEGLGKEAFQIDTGDCSFGSGCLRSEVFMKLALNRELRVVGSPKQIAASAAGRKHVVMGQIGSFSLGPFVHRGLILDSDATTSRLGLGYLSRYTVTFDMPGSTMYLRPGKDFDRTDRYDLSGVGIEQSGKVNIVRYIAPRSAGDLAGLQRGDAIVSVDSMSASDISLFEICRLFSSPGERRVVYERFIDRYETKLLLGVEKAPETKESPESPESMKNEPNKP